MHYLHHTFQGRSITLFGSGIGVIIAYAINIPLPFLFGPMAVCLALALCGVQFKGFTTVSAGVRTILGVAVGASITPDILNQLTTLATSVALVPLYVFLIGALGVPFFRKICRFDPPTAYYCAMPGGLPDMMTYGEAAGANLRILSLIHATRIVVVVTLAPILLTQVYNVSLTNPIGVPTSEMPPSELLLMLLAAGFGWWAAVRVGLFGAAIIGPMIVTAILSLAGYITVRPPEEALLAAQFFIGIGIGVHYIGITLRELQRIVLAGMAFMLVLAALVALMTVIVVHYELAKPAEAFLAFAPGGQAEITVLSIIAGADLSYVIAHQLARIVIVILGAPLVERLISKKH